MAFCFDLFENFLKLLGMILRAILIYTLQVYIALPGSKASKIVEQGHDKNALHGRGSAYSRQDADRLFRKLVIDGILFEELKITAMDTTACYIKLGRKANDVLNGKMKVCASRTVSKLKCVSNFFLCLF